MIVVTLDDIFTCLSIVVGVAFCVIACSGRKEE